MASRLLSAGTGLTVFDVDATRMETVAALGAVTTTSAYDIGERTEIVFSSLPSCEASLNVARDVLRGGRVKIYVETSTIGRATIGKILEMASTDITVVDAPISGGARAARDGTLALMIAAPKDVVRQLEPLLKLISAKIFHVGETPGLAQVCKLANNAIWFSTFVATCEAVVMGVKAGVSATALIDAINASTGRNAATTERFPNDILPRTFNAGGPLGGALKDLELYLDEAKNCGVLSGVVERVVETWKASSVELGENADFTTIVRYFERRAHVEVRR